MHAHRLVRLTLSILVFTSATAEAQPSADPSTASTSSATEGPRRHHAGFQVGVFNNSADAFNLGAAGLRDEGRTFFGGFNYRYSVSPFIDFTLHGVHWLGQWTMPESQRVELGAAFVGPGLRVHAWDRTKGRTVIPFFQTSIYFVQERLSFDQRRSATLTENGMGVGLGGGLEVVVSRRISIPIEVAYFAATGGADIDDLSGLGLSWGVTVRF